MALSKYFDKDLSIQNTGDQPHKPASSFAFSNRGIIDSGDMRQVLFLLIFSVYCHSAVMTTDFIDRCVRKFPAFAGEGNSVTLMCPGFTPHQWCVSQPNGSQSVLNVDEDSTLSTFTRHLRINDLTVDREGEYKCRRNSDNFISTQECVFIIGRAQFACNHYRNCTNHLTAAEGTTAVFDASVVFLQGGLYNQPLLFLRVRNGSQEVYVCNVTREGCTERERIKVEFPHADDEDTRNIIVTLKDLTMGDTGNYTIVFDTLHVMNTFTDDRTRRDEILLHYHLNVTEAEPTEPPAETTSETFTTETTTAEATTMQAETFTTETTTAEATTMQADTSPEFTTDTTTAEATSNEHSPSATVGSPTTDSVIKPDIIAAETLISVVVSVLITVVLIILVVVVVVAVACTRNRRELPLSPQKSKSHRNHVSMASETFEEVVLVHDSSYWPRSEQPYIQQSLQTGTGRPDRTSSTSSSNNSNSSSDRSSRSSPQTSTTTAQGSEQVIVIHQQSQRESLLCGSAINLSEDLFSQEAKV